MKKPQIHFRFRRPKGQHISEPSRAMTDALHRLTQSDEMQPLMSKARSDGKEVLIEVFQGADGQPLLIHPTLCSQSIQ